MSVAGEGVVVLGAGGRVGTLLRGSGAMPGAIWISRRGGDGVLGWDMLAGAAPPDALHGAGVMICLAGTVPGVDPRLDLSDNTRLALAAVEAAADAGVGHVLIASSIAVYGAGRAPWREDAALRPCSDYGHAKAGMEAAVQTRASGGFVQRDAGAGLAAPARADAGAIPAQRGRARVAGSRICLLRLGNVVGADTISAALSGGRPVTLDRCPGGGGPRRSVIGPVTLARVLLALAARAQSGAALPLVLNIAQPGPVALAALCRAAGRSFGWCLAGPATLPLAEMDTSALQALLPAPLPPADPAALIGEWRAAEGRR